MINTKVNLAGVELKNPVMEASGTFGSGAEYGEFVDLNKLTHDLVVDLGVEKSKSLFMWVPAGIYDFCPKGKIDNTHLNIYGGKVVAGIAMEAVAKVVPALAPYVRHYDPEVYAADYEDNKISF